MNSIWVLRAGIASLLGVMPGALIPGGGHTTLNVPFRTWQLRYIDWFRDLGFLQKPEVEIKADRDTAAFVSEPAKAGGSSEASGETALLAESGTGLKALQMWYSQDTGLWTTTGWWNSANALTVLVDYSRLSKSNEFLPAIANTFQRNAHTRFLNKFYDDEGWWALAWAGAYDLTREDSYLAMAEEIFADMTRGWDDHCGGGIWWSKDNQYKNAIANELFLSAAAELANLTQDHQKRSKYLEWARREWTWFASSGMINADHLVNDGLDSACHNNQRTTWTYNQGVILGGLDALSKEFADSKMLDVAHSIASAAISKLADHNGILHDPCEPDHCGKDAPQFKGIFVRNLGTLYSAVPDAQFRTFLHANAESIWKNRDPNDRFAVVWSGPSELKNAATQVSGLDALLAAAEVDYAASK